MKYIFNMNTSVGFLLKANFVWIFLSFYLNATGQITYTRSFTDRLQEAHLEYYKPVETWHHVSPKRKDRYMQYDLVLVNEENDLELRYMIKPYADDAVDQYPHVETMRLIQHVATNDEEADIRVLMPDSETLARRFNAEWGLCQYFTPKRTYSEKPFGALITLYAKGKAMIQVVILYQDASYDPFESFHFLKFRE